MTKKYFISLFDLIFPKTCAACGTNLVKNEDIFCVKCLYDLPRTGFHNDKENITAKLFWGVADIKLAASWFYFHKESKFQAAIHKLKYSGQKIIGIEMGKLYGIDLKDSEFSDIDLIIPVPLHPAKKRIRGYNQSEMIAIGMSQSMNIKTDFKNFIRTVFTETQTKKNLEERRKNVAKVFKLKNPSLFENKHILIVDDILTTGSTLASCVNEIKESCNCEVSIATLGYATQ